MKKDKLSMLILIVEIVAITALHAVKDGQKSIARAEEKSQTSSSYITSTLQPGNYSYLILPGFPY